jgi:hypothetical protein
VRQVKHRPGQRRQSGQRQGSGKGSAAEHEAILSVKLNGSVQTQ